MKNANGGAAGPDTLGAWLDWAVAARYEDLPAQVVAASKTGLLNTSAAMLAGSSAPGVPEIVRQVREWGGRPESTVAVYGLKIPAPMAASWKYRRACAQQPTSRTNPEA